MADEPREGMRGPARTAFFGHFGEFEAELVLDILRAEGIFAYAKRELGDAESAPYGPILSDRGIVIVDADRLTEARRIVGEQLPQQIEAIREAMEALDAEPQPEEEE